MKYLNSFNSVGALNNFYKGKDYKEPNVNMIKTSENEDPIVDMSSEYDIICFFDITENLNGSYLIPNYDLTSLESIIVDGNRYRVKDLPLNKSDLEPGEHIIKLKYKNKTIFGNLSNNAPVFTNTYLKKIIIPKGIENINQNVCNGCTSLTSITIPDSVTSIGANAFSGCSLESIYINFNEFNNYPIVSYLGLNTSKLKSFTLGNRINNIPNYAFSGCSSLTSITIPDSVTSIGTSAFSGCSSLTSITIPYSVTSIGTAAFGSCTSLTSITIPNSVTSIGEAAFGSCTSLTSITIPNSVTSIGSNAFNGCQLESIYINYEEFNNSRSIISYLGLKQSFLKSVTLGNRVNNIPNYAFSNCSSLTSITIPDSVTSIGSNAFSDCSSLTSITIPDSVTSIGSNAFNGCPLESIYINFESFNSYHDLSYFGLNKSSLKSVTFGDNINKLESLYGYNQLENSYIENGIRYIDIDNFGTYILEITDYTLQNYTIKEGVNSLPFIFNSSFTNIQSITLPNSLKYIQDNCFNYLYENNILTQEQIDFILNINENGISNVN